MTQTSTPKVSIGLPVYNGEPYVAEAIEAILAQTFADFELIISDNASNDATREICLRFAAGDRRIRYYRNETNLGAGPNFNRTFALARGEYFKWAAHDDLLEPEFLERCLLALEADPTAILCQTMIKHIDEVGRPIRAWYGPLLGVDHPDPSRRFAQAVLTTDHSCEDIFGLIRTHVLATMPLHEGCLDTDRIVLAELALRGRFIHVPERLFIQREHGKRFLNAAYSDRDARIAWYDPSQLGDRSWHSWKVYRSYYGAVGRSSLDWPERLRCYGHLLRWLSVNSDVVGRLFNRKYYSFGRKAVSLE